MGGPAPLEGATVKATIEVSELAQEIADLVFALEAAIEVEDWEAVRWESSWRDERVSHPCNPGGGDWCDTIPKAPEWFAAEIDRVTLAPYREIAAGRELADVWPPYDGPDSFAWEVANMITESGGGGGWNGDAPPRPVAGHLYIRVTPSTVALEWVSGAWRGPLDVARRRLADARRRNPGGNAASYWAARVENLDGGNP